MLKRILNKNTSTSIATQADDTEIDESLKQLQDGQVEIIKDIKEKDYPMSPKMVVDKSKELEKMMK